MLQAKDLEHAYVLDYSDMTQPKSIKLEIKSTSKKQSFNLYSAIVPQNFGKEDKNHRQTRLLESSFEY